MSVRKKTKKNGIYLFFVLICKSNHINSDMKDNTALEEQFLFNLQKLFGNKQESQKVAHYLHRDFYGT